MKILVSVPSLRALCPLLCIPITLALGCQDPDFNTPELLKNPRVLAVQAEPPQPSYGSTTTLRALIYQPPARTEAPECVGAEPGPKYQWSWCPLATSSVNGYECPMKQSDLDLLAAMLGLGQAPQLDLGTGETATLLNPFPAALLYGLCTDQFQLPSAALPAGASAVGVDAGTSSGLSCEYSVGDNAPDKLRKDMHPIAFPVTVMLKYTPPCGSPAQDKYGPELTTVFTVRLPTDETLPPDQNPTVGDIIFATSGFDRDAGVPDSAPKPAPVDAGSSDDGGGDKAIDGGEVDGGGAIDGGTQAMDGGQPGVAVQYGKPPEGSKRLDSVWLPRQKRVGLWLDLPTSASEPLPRPSTSDEVKKGDVLYFERVNRVWFAEAGDFGGPHGSYPRRGGYLPPYNQTDRPLDEDQQFEERVRKTMWALPTNTDYPKSTARVIVVVRDSRGGVAWASAVANLETQP